MKIIHKREKYYMGLKSDIIERKFENFLQSAFFPDGSYKKKKLQRKRFLLLSKLIADLFENKNSRDCFNDISNLIILILNIYNEKFPVDIYSLKEKESLKEFDSKYKHILKHEFLND